MKAFFLPLFSLLVCAFSGAIPAQAQSTYEPYYFGTFAGLAGSFGSADGTGSAARFNYAASSRPTSQSAHPK